jgi:heptosyltransferase-1
MKRVLIIKTSSMGDVIHTLPALTDAQQMLPGILFDWVVEEGFAEIPSWHPAVDRVIPVAIRRWRKNIVRSLRGTEIGHFKAELAHHHYDLVIDAQGLMKSAWITRFINAPCVGYDRRSVREPFATMAYQLKVPVAREMHAVERTRELFAAALNYSKPQQVGEYQLDKKSFKSFDPAARSLIFIHSTTQNDKHWPEVYWRRLCELMIAQGYTVNLPWGTDAERVRSIRLE